MAWEWLKIQNMYSVTLVVTSRISDVDMHIQDGGTHNDFV
jgi:hypothetical protein